MKKDNLLFQLDLLEGLLNKAKDQEKTPSTRLKRTKYAVEKRSTVQDQQSLIRQINDLKSQLVDRKFHFTTVQISRALKSAYSTEKLKIRKRKDRLKPEEQITKGLVLDKEAEILETKTKDQTSIFHPSKLSIIVIGRFLKRTFGRNGMPVFFSSELLQMIENATKTVFEATENNVFARLCALTNVKNALNDLKANIERIDTGERQKAPASSTDTKNKVKNEAKKKAEDYEEGEEEDDSDDSDAHGDGDKDDSDSDDDLSQYAGMVANSDSEDSEDEDGDDGHTGHKKNSSSSDDDDSDKEKSTLNDPFFSTELPTLASGYISGSDDEDNYDYDNDAQVKSITSERKNRRGQRARRRIWELKYGRKANHVIKEKQDYQAKREQKQKDFEAREAKRKEKALKQAHAGIEAPSQRIVPNEKGSFNAKTSTGAKRKETADGPLHPSWEAKKKQKASAQFEGKKVKFD